MYEKYFKDVFAKAQQLNNNFAVAVLESISGYSGGYNRPESSGFNVIDGMKHLNAMEVKSDNTSLGEYTKEPLVYAYLKSPSMEDSIECYLVKTCVPHSDDKYVILLRTKKGGSFELIAHSSGSYVVTLSKMKTRINRILNL